MKKNLSLTAVLLAGTLVLNWCVSVETTQDYDLSTEQGRQLHCFEEAKTQIWGDNFWAEWEDEEVIDNAIYVKSAVIADDWVHNVECSYGTDWSWWVVDVDADYNNQANQDEEIEDTTLPEGAKTSLTIEELENIDEEHFPTSYTYTTYNFDTENKDEGDYTYPEDLSHSLLIPEHATMISREVVSSGIEDGMIYTLTNATLQDGTVIEILYINDPVTLEYVAASVQNGNENRNYQFQY